MSLYTSSVRPLLFKLPPERAQWVAETLLFAGPIWRAVSSLDDPRLSIEVAGIQLPSPVGLAAGYDKDCRFLHRLGNFGFGYAVGGTVLRDSRKGNDSPRIVRRPNDGALVNSMGFPSGGLKTAEPNLSRRGRVDFPRLVSIAGFSVEEYVECYRMLGPLCDGVEVNISCPNMEDPRFFQNPTRFGELLSELQNAKTAPLFIKLPPYFDDNERDDMIKLVDVCLDHGVEGVTVSNTRPEPDERLEAKKGGLSGKPLFPHTLRMVADIRNHAGDDLVINGCGGIFSGKDALQVLNAGANTLQIYTGFVYGGPRTIKRIKRYLLDHMEREGISSLSALTGRASRDLRVPVTPSASVTTPVA